MLPEQDKRRYIKIREKGIKGMMESERPQVAMEGALQAIGALEETEGLGVRLCFIKAVTVFVAKFSLNWTEEDIEESIELGRQHARMQEEFRREMKRNT